MVIITDGTEAADMEQGQGTIAFDRGASQALKGIAIMMLVLHHTFASAGHYKGYAISFFPFGETQVQNLGMACKICVSIFAFISGYGLYLSYSRHRGTATRWCAKRYVKTFSGYWLVWLLTAVICQLIDGHTVRYFLKDGGYNGLLYGVLDLLGVGMVFTTPRLIGSAWYMGAAAVFILLTPMICHWKDELWLLLALHIVFLRIILAYDESSVRAGFTTIYPFITPFLLGGMFARYGWMDRWMKVGLRSRWAKAYKLAAEAWLLIFGYKLYQKTPWNTFWDYHFGLFPVLVILFCVEFVVTIPGLGAALRFLGRHSMNIFLIHGTLRKYCRDIVFMRGHFIVCFLTLLLLSLAVSMLVEALKKVVKCEKYVDWLEAKTDG